MWQNIVDQAKAQMARSRSTRRTIQASCRRAIQPVLNGMRHFTVHAPLKMMYHRRSEPLPFGASEAQPPRDSILVPARAVAATSISTDHATEGV